MRLSHRVNFQLVLMSRRCSRGCLVSKYREFPVPVIERSRRTVKILRGRVRGASKEDRRRRSCSDWRRQTVADEVGAFSIVTVLSPDGRGAEDNPAVACCNLALPSSYRRPRLNIARGGLSLTSSLHVGLPAEFSRHASARSAPSLLLVDYSIGAHGVLRYRSPNGTV